MVRGRHPKGLRRRPSVSFFERRARDEFTDDPLVQKIVAFVRAGGKRPLMRPPRKTQAQDEKGDA